MGVHMRVGTLLTLLLLIVVVGVTGCRTAPDTTMITTQPTVDEPGTRVPPERVKEPSSPDVVRYREPNLKDIRFDYDKSDIRSDQESILTSNIAWIKNNPELDIAIVGHCDERGSNRYNLALGERRAVSVFHRLVDAGIDSNRIYPSSMGEEEPIDPRHNEEAWAKNRRVEFWVIKR